jgi:hypothetical protein
MVNYSMLADRSRKPEIDQHEIIKVSMNTNTQVAEYFTMYNNTHHHFRKGMQKTK